ncbi:sulfurtransferase [Alicyclobacillus curvatus]|nr:sulfurtransferase [Alicyclobacillus curvatus]
MILLIEAAELARLMETQEVVVFDCRFSLGDPNQGFTAYLTGHIPGAHYLHLEHDLSSPVQEHGGRHPLPDMSEFAGKVAMAGATKSTTVVVYDAGGGMAPRAWWLLDSLGVKDVRMLNGGWNAFVSAGLPVSQAIPAVAPEAAATARAEFDVEDTSNKVVNVEEVRAIVAGDVTGMLVDARAANRYRGEVEPIDKVAGHIPGALNAPWEEGLDEAGRWLDADKQRQRFAKAVEAQKPLVMYCGSGVSACANLFALRLAGIENAKLYPGSWSDWSSYSEHPVGRGMTP